MNAASRLARPRRELVHAQPVLGGEVADLRRGQPGHAESAVVALGHEGAGALEQLAERGGVGRGDMDVVAGRTQRGRSAGSPDRRRA
jgi:hypothetical protein